MLVYTGVGKTSFFSGFFIHLQFPNLSTSFCLFLKFIGNDFHSHCCQPGLVGRVRPLPPALQNGREEGTAAVNPSAISGTDPRPAAITFGPSLLELPSVDAAVPPPPLAALAEGFPHSRSTLQLALEHSSPVLRTEHSGSYLSTESDSPAHLAALE
eukprot:EG_transcript_39597